MNYTICTGGKNTSNPTGEGDLKKLHEYFLPESNLHGQKIDDLNTLEAVLGKPVWQVSNLRVVHDIESITVTVLS